MGGTAADEEAPVGGEAYAVGTTVAGRYRIIRFIAAGGMGSVHEAEDLLLGGRVALKTLRADQPASPRAVERMRREIALSRRITHENVCRMYDLGEDAGRVFLTMELLEGETLSARLRRGPLAADELDVFATQLVAALGAAHAQGVIHRDLKSSNIVLVDERAVVTDFGLARATADGAEVSLTGDGGLVGTPAYMAPEQVEGRPATAASDIYALGVVLFEMATGELPFREDTAMATATARLHKDPPRPSARRPGLDRRWDAVIARCLARAPSDRFARAADVLGDPGTRPARRRWLAAAIALVAIAGIVATAVTTGRLGFVARHATHERPARYFPHDLRPLSVKAATHFDQAHAELDADRWNEARMLLEQAARADPDDPAAQAALADVLAALGYRERAVDAAARAMTYRERLGDIGQRVVESIDAAIRRDAAAELAALARVVAAVPRDRAARLRLAQRLAAAGRPDDARAAVRAMGTLEGDAERIAALRIEAALALDAGDLAAVTELATRARTLAQKAGRVHDEAEALILAGAAHWRLGHDADAVAAYEHAIALGTSIGHTGVVFRARSALADLDLSVDRLGLVASRYRENVALVRSLGDRELLVDLLQQGARWLMHVGAVEEANAYLDEALPIATDLGNPRTVAWVHATTAYVLYERGRLADVGPHDDAAYAVGQQLGVPGLRGNPFHVWSMTLLELDDAAALARLRATRKEPVERLVDCFTAFREGDLDKADRIGRALANVRTGEGRLAQVVSARVAVRRDRLDEAGRLLDEVAPGMIGDGASPVARDSLVQARAELRAARGDLPGALRDLDALDAECTRLGLLRCAMDTARVAAELAASADAARAERTIARARAAGFRRTAREIEVAQRNAAASRP